MLLVAFSFSNTEPLFTSKLRKIQISKEHQTQEFSLSSPRLSQALAGLTLVQRRLLESKLVLILKRLFSLKVDVLSSETNFLIKLICPEFLQTWCLVFFFSLELHGWKNLWWSFSRVWRAASSSEEPKNAPSYRQLITSLTISHRLENGNTCLRFKLT